MRPSSQLRPFVTGYADFDMTGWPPGRRHRGLPDGTLTLVISFGAPLVIRQSGHPDLAAAATVAGLRSAPLDVVHDGTQRGVQVGLTPRGCRALLGRPAAELANGVWSLPDVAGPRAHELIDRVAEARGPAERARVLEAVLARWAADTGYPAAVDAFWRRLTCSGGRATVTSIAGQIGLSPRHLGQLVRAELGLTPKTAARVLRFGQTRACLRAGRASSLAQAAAMCGYFDQAHLTGDWKQLGGCTPGQWVSEELPFLRGRV